MWRPPKRRKKWPWLRTILLALVLAVAVVVVARAYSDDRGDGAAPIAIAVQVSDEALWVDEANTTWQVNVKERVSACDNRPGLKKIYVTVLDEWGAPLRGVKVRFETEPSEGIAYDHMDVWGWTNGDGYIEWNHLGVPTRYILFMEDDEIPLVANIRTDLGNEYCRQREGYPWAGNVPVNRPGIYSYRLEIQMKGSE
jgi:hypothetical protein